MNKSELINAVSEEVAGTPGDPITSGDVKKVIEALFVTITDVLSTGGDVTVPQFGKFEVRQRAERQGHNPHTGDPLTIAAKKVPAFKAQKPLKDAVNS